MIEMTRVYGRRSGLALFVAATVLAALTGCGDQVDEAIAPIEPTIEETASPEAAAATVIRCLQDERKAIAAHDHDASKKCRGRLLGLADRKRVEEGLRRDMRFAAVLHGDISTAIIDLWGAAISYYLDGADLDSMTRDPAATTETDVAIQIPARGKDDETTLAVRCSRNTDGTWRVWRVSFAKQMPAPHPIPAAASQPVPASQPAP